MAALDIYLWPSQATIDAFGTFPLEVLESYVSQAYDDASEGTNWNYDLTLGTDVTSDHYVPGGSGSEARIDYGHFESWLESRSERGDDANHLLTHNPDSFSYGYGSSSGHMSFTESAAQLNEFSDTSAVPVDTQSARTGAVQVAIQEIGHSCIKGTDVIRCDDHIMGKNWTSGSFVSFHFVSPMLFTYEDKYEGLKNCCGNEVLGPDEGGGGMFRHTYSQCTIDRLKPGPEDSCHQFPECPGDNL